MILKTTTGTDPEKSSKNIIKTVTTPKCNFTQLTKARKVTKKSYETLYVLAVDNFLTEKVNYIKM